MTEGQQVKARVVDQQRQQRFNVEPIRDGGQFGQGERDPIHSQDIPRAKHG